MQVRFRAIGRWEEGKVIARWVADSRRREAAVERGIELEWERALRGKRATLFDGPMCRLEAFRAGDGLELDLSRTSYKIFWGTNLNHNEIWREHGADVMANGIGMSCAVQSAEGWLVLGKRSMKVAYYPGRVHPFAGTLEPAEPMDVMGEMRRELREELGLEASELGKMTCVGIIEDASILQPELVFEATSLLSRAEIGKKLDQSEHDGCVWVEPAVAEVDWALEKPELTPVALGTVLLWGRGKFGQDWFDAREHVVNLRG